MKKQIDFNHELIGKEGITVERRDGVGIDFVKAYDNYLRVLFSTGFAYSYNFDGVHQDNDCTLLMFQEITEMSGEEWFNNTYLQPACSLLPRKAIAAAFDAGKQHIKELHNIK